MAEQSDVIFVENDGTQRVLGLAEQGPPGRDGIVPALVVASEALLPGDWVNIWSLGGAPRVRKASGNQAGYRCHGFVVAPYSIGAMATVYGPGTINNLVLNQIAGTVYLSVSPGLGTNSGNLPSGTGRVIQEIGIAFLDTHVWFQPSMPITLT